MDKVYESFCTQDTLEIANKIAAFLEVGNVVAIDGELGAGKTELARGICYALGVTDKVVSPTFTILNEYSGNMPIYHFDVYRINNSEEMHDIGFDDFIYGEGISIIEWAEKIKNILPRKYIEIKIDKNYDKGEEYRAICVKEVSN